VAAPPVLSRRANLLCFVAVIIGAVLRFWAIGKDIPYGVGIDEPAIMDHALDMVRTGSLNPRGFFDYGTLSMYLQVSVIVVRFLSGAMQGQWSSLGQTSSADYFLWGRVLTAMIGVGTIPVVYRIASRWGERTALLAAAIMAVQPWHVRESHFVLTDVPLTFMVAAAMLASLRAAESRALTWLAASALFAGLAAATKYNGAYAVLIPLTVAALWPAARGRAMLLVLGAFGAAFLAGAPYTLLDLPGFLNSFGDLVKHFSQTRPAALSIYLKHIRNSLDFGTPEWGGVRGSASALLGWLFLCAAGLGLLVALWRAIGQATFAPALGFLVFVFFYFRLLSNQSGQIFARYLMPIVPLIALGLALAVVCMLDILARKIRAAGPRLLASTAVVAFAIIPAAAQPILWDHDTSKVSAAHLTYEWMLTHIRPGELMVVESYSLRPPAPRFRVMHTERLINEPLDAYRAEGATYLIATSSEYEKFTTHPDTIPIEYRAYETLFRNTEEIARFDSGPNNSPGPTFRVLRIPR
jgi:4-amino-4-deoxy-L-arabinose transferase-like glycosyltransferase